MDREMEYLMKLLRGFLWKTPVQPEEGLDWPRLMTLASQQNLEGILGYMSMGSPIAPEALRPRLRQNCLQTIALYNRREVLANQFLDCLARAGIDHCLMKGLLLRHFYPVPELRTFSDVDVLIRREDRQAAHQLMLEMGFQVKDDWEPTYSYLRGEEYYELHSQLLEVDVSPQVDYREYFGRVWEHTYAIAPHTYRMEMNYHLLYLLTHIAKHVSGSGAGIRMYLDIAAGLQFCDEKLDWKWIMEQLEVLQLRKFGCAVLTAAESWFGAPCRGEFPRLSGESLERFAQFTLEAGIFGHHGRDSALAVLKKRKGSRLKVLLGRMFPRAKTIQSRYTYLQKRPWLLPVAWVHRLFKTSVSLKDHAWEARGILTYDDAEAKRLRDICEEVGLK